MRTLIKHSTLFVRGSREGFALGAVVAAEFLVGQPAGFYSMSDLMKE